LRNIARTIGLLPRVSRCASDRSSFLPVHHGCSAHGRYANLHTFRTLTTGRGSHPRVSQELSLVTPAVHTDPAVTVTQSRSCTWSIVVHPGMQGGDPGHNAVSTPYPPGWYVRGILLLPLPTHGRTKGITHQDASHPWEVRVVYTQGCLSPRG